MISLQDIEARVNQLKKAVENSANNHNVLVGRLSEVMYIFDFFSKLEKTNEEIANKALEEQQEVKPEEKQNNVNVEEKKDHIIE